MRECCAGAASVQVLGRGPSDIVFLIEAQDRTGLAGVFR